MTDVEIPIVIWILLGVQTGLLLLVWLGQILQARRLRRIERRISARTAGGVELQRVQSGSLGGQRLFDKWLDEDPSRRELPKKEQFAGFRQWRSEQGMNWDSEKSGSGS